MTCSLGHEKQSVALEDHEYYWEHVIKCRRCGVDLSFKQPKSDTTRIVEAIRERDKE